MNNYTSKSSSQQDDEKKEEIEDAFKSDFTKKRPTLNVGKSLLTSMFAQQDEKQSAQKDIIEQDNSQPVLHTDLSSSLKQNVDWEHQSAYNIKTEETAQFDWHDNFSRW